MSESATALDFSRLLQSRGIVGNAAMWLQKALHPSGASPVAVCIPDESRVPSVCMDYRPTMVIQPPSGLAEDGLWDCLIWNPPGDATAAVVAFGPAGTNFNTADIQSRVLSNQSSTLQGPYQCIWLGTSSAVKDSVSQVISGPSYAPSSLPLAFRTSYRSVTASLTASSLNNQGTVYSTQFARNFIPKYDWRNYVTGESGEFNTFANIQMSYLPFDEDTLNILSPGAETRPARDGVYMPLRLNGPSQPFSYGWPTEASQLQTTRVDAGVGSTVLWKPIVTELHADETIAYYPTTIPQVPYPVTNPNPGASGEAGALRPFPRWAENNMYTVFDTAFDNVSQGVTIFRGLSKEATITLQVYVGLEMIPRQDSPVISFCRSPGAPDVRALQLYYEIVNTMAVSYPARYNSFGTLLPLLISAARMVLPHVPAIATFVRDAVRSFRSPPALPANIRPLTSQPRLKTPPPKGKAKSRR